MNQIYTIPKFVLIHQQERLLLYHINHPDKVTAFLLAQAAFRERMKKYGSKQSILPRIRLVNFSGEEQRYLSGDRYAYALKPPKQKQGGRDRGIHRRDRRESGIL